VLGSDAPAILASAEKRLLTLSAKSARQGECAKDSVKQQRFVEGLDQNGNGTHTLEQMPSLCVIATSHHYHR